MRSEKAKPAPLGVIGKVLAILELLDQAPLGLKLKEIADRSGFNKSTAHRFLSHLVSADYLIRGTDGAYIVGPNLTRLGTGVGFHSTLVGVARPVMENLRKLTGETINLAVLDGSDVVYIEVLETGHTFRLVSTVGIRRPYYCTSLGKAILANLKDEQRREELISSVRFEAATPRSITTVVRLKKQLLTIKKRGYSLDDEEAVTGIRCLGAAIYDKDGEAVAAISISGPTVRVTTEKVPEFSAEICKASRKISRLLSNVKRNSSK